MSVKGLFYPAEDSVKIDELSLVMSLQFLSSVKILGFLPFFISDSLKIPSLLSCHINKYVYDLNVNINKYVYDLKPEVFTRVS